MESGKKSSCAVAKKQTDLRALHRIALVALLSLAACDASDDCKRAVDHLIDITMSAPPGVKASTPSADEQRIADFVKSQSIATCRAEKLDPAARDCILAMKSVRDLETLGTCPGIVAHRPSWVMAGPPPAAP